MMWFTILVALKISKYIDIKNLGVSGIIYISVHVTKQRSFFKIKNNKVLENSQPPTSSPLLPHFAISERVLIRIEKCLHKLKASSHPN